MGISSRIVAVAALLLGLNVYAGPVWEAARAEFIEGLFELSPVFAVSQGRHEFDGQIGDLSKPALADKATLMRDTIHRVRAIPQTELIGRDAFERDLLLWYCDRQLFWLERARWPFVNPEYYGGKFSPSVYITRDYASVAQRLMALTRWLHSVPTALAQMQGNLEVPLPRVYVERAIGRFGGLATYLKDEVPLIFEDAGDDVTRAAFESANDRAVTAFASTAAWFRAQLSSARDDFAMGAPMFAEMLRRSERVMDSLAVVTQRNETDLARNSAALAHACAQFAPGASVGECVARVEAEKPPAGPVAAATTQLAQLEAFVRARDLVSIPLPDRALVAEAPPYARANSAYIERPGAFEKAGLPATFYIAPPDPDWTLAEQEAYIPSVHGLLFTSIHEVWPGHFLQGLHARAHAPLLGQLLRATTFSEGWAHYSEELMWQAGVGGGDVRLRIAQLVNALWRNVRFRSAVGLHTQGMTLAESERAFREVAHLDPGSARQQAARGAYDPDYLSYTLGKLQIRELRDEWITTRGATDGWKAFHDQLLSFGAPPVSLAREYMLPR